MRVQLFTAVTANVVSSIVFYLMGKGELVFIKLSLLPSILIQIVFFGLTELVPLLSFVKISKNVVSPEFW